MENSKAIVTLAIGQYYRDRWYKLCADNWQKYAQKYGYDVLCIDTHLDDSPRAQARCPAWQKCLILSDERVQKYDQVVWIDSDILINPASPCIFTGVPEDKVGAVEMFTGPLGEILPGESLLLVDRARDYWHWSFRTGKEFYSTAGFPDQLDLVVQTGVMVLSPKHHRSLYEHVYYNYEETVNNNFEMEALSYEILKADCIHWLDYRFNRLWFECMLRDYPFLLAKPSSKSYLLRALRYLSKPNSRRSSKNSSLCSTTAFLNNYFLHFAGTGQYMAQVNTDISSWRELWGKF